MTSDNEGLATDTSESIEIEALITEWARHSNLKDPPNDDIPLWSDEYRALDVAKKWGPPIPYGPIDHGDGEKNHGYVRLKGNSTAIGQIPEVQGWPEFRQFLEAVNAIDSPIESAGCERGFSPFEPKVDPTVVDAGSRHFPTVFLGSYVDLMFTDHRLNERPEKVLLLATALLKAVKGCDQWWAHVEIGVQRFRPQDVQHPWGLTLRVINYGRTQDEARRWWGETLSLLGKAVSSLPKDFGRTT